MDIVPETERIKEFIERGNFHAAINVSISAMNQCRKEQEQENIDYFINMMKDIVDIMDNEFGSKGH